MNENYRDTITSVEDMPEVDDVAELNEKIENVKQLREGGEGWYDACLSVADTDTQTYVLLRVMLTQLRNERENLSETLS